MKGAWRFWVELFDTRELGVSLALFRVLVSCVILYSLLSIAAADLLDVLWVDREHGGYRNLGRGNWLVSAMGGPTPDNVWGLWMLCVTSTVCLLAGLLGRPVAFITLQSYNALISINGDTVGGYDTMMINALWLLFLGRSTATLSLDCWFKHRRLISDELIAAWPRYLLIFQLAVIYTATGLHKVSLTWNPLGGYSALHWVFQDPTWRRLDLDFLAWVYPLTQLGTAVTWHWETLTPLLLLAYYYRYTSNRPGRLRWLFNRRDLRSYWAAVGIMLHVGILLTLNVGPFSWISMSYYVCLYRPDELTAVWQHLRSAKILEGVNFAARSG